MGGWIGVDLDATLAEYGGWKGYSTIGKPICPMVDRIKGWLAQGKEVRIFTARVCRNMGEIVVGAEADTEKRIKDETLLIQDWLERECALPRLAVTCEKDFAMIELWDDRAIQMIPNTGLRADGKL